MASKPDISFVDKLVKQDKNKKKENNKMKFNKETIKTIVITVLVTAIVSFTAGMAYQADKNAQVKAEAVSLVKTVADAKPASSKQ